MIAIADILQRNKAMQTELRTPGQSLRIGTNVVVRVLEVDRNQIRIGIEAPRDIDVDRPEIREKKLASKLETAK